MSRIPSSPMQPMRPKSEGAPTNPAAAPSGTRDDDGRGLSGNPQAIAEPPTQPLPTGPKELPYVHSMGGADQAAFLTDEQYLHDFLKESYTLPKIIIAGGVVATFGIFAYVAGPAGALLGSVLAAGFLAVATVICLISGWITCKLFGDDYGSIGTLLLRFSAVAAAVVPVYNGITLIAGPWIGFLIAIPVGFGITMWVAGFDFFRTLVFNGISWIVSWIMIAFVFMSVMAS